ncbi:MAG: transporter [Gammaproteobacteria bacterium]|nr:transporter [Gammaproteobacteria bacterium]
MQARSHMLDVLRAMIAISSICVLHSVLAQDLEPRAYANTPTGLNFVLAGYQYSEGALVFDPVLPVTDASAKVNIALFGYVRTLGIANKSAKVGLLVPVAGLDASGYVDSVFRTREDSGLADPAFYFTINLFGAPAMSFEDFKDFQQNTIVGMTFKLTAPLGVYDNDKLLNIGTNRWSFEPEIGISQALGPLTVEAAAAALLFGDNDDFDGGKTRQQDPIYSIQGHVIYAFRSGIWTAIGATYYSGGRTSIDGVSNNDLQQNWRGGFTLAVPIDRHHSIKIFANSGVSTRTGTDYDSLGIAWQYRWGKGF